MRLPVCQLTSHRHARARAHTHIQVKNLNVQYKLLGLDDGRTILYDKLLIATGGRPKSLAVFDNAEDGVRERVLNYRNVSRAAGAPACAGVTSGRR